MDKKIDIIIPVYKAHDVLGRALDSVKYQTIVDKIQVTLVNDHCPEGSYDTFIQEYKDFFDIREIVMGRNVGPGYCRQHGVDNTDNEYFFFLDADDMIMNPFGMQLLLGTMEDYPSAAMSFAPVCEENKTGGMVYVECDTSWVFGRLFRRSFIQESNIRFITSRSNEDVLYLLLVRFALAGIPNCVRLLQQPIYAKRFSVSSISGKNDQAFEHDYNFIGYVNSVILASLMGIKNNCLKEEIESVVFNCFLYIWMTYNMAIINRPELEKQNWEHVKKYYYYLHDYINYIPNDMQTSLKITNFLKDYYMDASDRQTPYSMKVELDTFCSKLAEEEYDPATIYEIYGNDVQNEYKVREEQLFQTLRGEIDG